MKKLLAATAMVVALLSGAGAATAGTYQGVASHNGAHWTVTWSNVSPTCSLSSLRDASSTVVFTINGLDESILTSYITEKSFNNINSIDFAPSSAGVLNKITFQGQSSFQCDGHTFLLPGYVAPAPAPVPTLSEWAMILLGVVLAGGAALTIHRRRTA